MENTLAYEKAVADPPRKEIVVPYRSDGIIDWEQLDDNLEDPESDAEFKEAVAVLDVGVLRAWQGAAHGPSGSRSTSRET